MKVSRTYTIDEDLVRKLNSFPGNRSILIEELLYNHFAKLEKENTIESIPLDKVNEDINKLKELKKEVQEKQRKEKELEKAGLSKEKMDFLKKMSDNIMLGKHYPFEWKRRFNEDKKWSELIELKKKWS